jgi:dihydroorotate dehydrogenase
MYPLIRSVLFRLDPEKAHGLTINAIRIAGSLPLIRFVLHRIYSAPPKPVQAFGLNFINPIGLAAGYDKDGLGWRGLACLGFGHIEVGSVTLRPQPGNPKPRVFRLPQDNAIINRMGFPGQGAVAVSRRLQAPRPAGLILGVNFGKNKDTPLEQAEQDYVPLIKAFASLADYLAINVSSPNTVGLRRLQARDMLENLLKILDQERKLQENILCKRIPMLVKLAPDLSDEELDDALAAIQQQGMDGVIATNTTVDHSAVSSPNGKEVGGMSGSPLFPRSYEMVKKIIYRSQGQLPVVGVGGIMTPDGAKAMLEAGAALIQVYTGLIYTGPSLVQQVLKEIV